MTIRHKYSFVMKKWLKITLKVVAPLLLLIIIAGIGGWMWFSSSFLSFEKDYEEKLAFEERTIDGYTFLDRNENGTLEVYEDARKSRPKRCSISFPIFVLRKAILPMRFLF